MLILDLAWLGWIAAATLACWLLPRRFRPWGIAAFALAFLLYQEPPSAILLAAMAAVTLWTGKRTDGKRPRIGATVVLLLGALAAFKAFAGGNAGFAMPLGMSYYTFRCVHYLLERVKRGLPPHTTAEFLAYIFFLPTIVAGPIHRFPDFHRDLRRARFEFPHLSAGLERILYGYAKILLLANFLLQQHVDPALSTLAASHSWLATYLGMLSGGLMGYLLFAGYSDVAIGAARLSGFRVIENFDNPFISRNIIEFWRRWHISLTSWVRDYLYTTVFSLTRRPYLAALLAMLVIGLWHEVSARYVIWGLAHGIAVALCQWYQRRRSAEAVVGIGLRAIFGRLIGWGLTFHFVMLSFVLVQHDLDTAVRIYATLLGVSV